MNIFERFFRKIKRNVLNVQSRPINDTVNSLNKSINNIKIPPINKDNVLYYYLPLQGLVSYTTLAVNVMNPHLLIRLFPRRDVTDLLFISAGTGAGLWLWARPHMAAAAPARRFSWALLGGCLWPLGSIFLWAIMRNAIGRRPIIGTILGVGTGVILTNTARDYFHYIELMFCGELHIPEEVYSPNSDDEKYDIDI